MWYHINKNKTWIVIGFAEMWIGFIILMRNQLLDVRLPPILGLFDDVPIGMTYLILGVLIIVNFTWDFYWYGIRLVLICLSEMVFVLLFTSYLFNDLIHGYLTFFTGFAFLFAVDILWQAYKEPPHKLGIGGRK